MRTITRVILQWGRDFSPPPLQLYCENKFCIYNLHHSSADIIHLLHPQHIKGQHFIQVSGNKTAAGTQYKECSLPLFCALYQYLVVLCLKNAHP